MELGPIATNAYLLWEEGGKEAILIDAPPGCSDAISGIMEREHLTLSAIWLTHGHWDHMAGASVLCEEGVEVLGHQEDQVLFEQPALMSSFAIPGLELEPVKITRWIEHGEELDMWGRKVEVRHCPGHCPGNVILWVGEESQCFVGDVIFAGSVGRADLPGGDFDALERSIRQQVYTLPENTQIHPGHGPDTSVGAEMQSNPFVRP